MYLNSKVAYRSIAPSLTFHRLYRVIHHAIGHHASQTENPAN